MPSFLKCLKNGDETTLLTMLQTCQRMRTTDKTILTDPVLMVEALKPLLGRTDLTQVPYERLTIVFAAPNLYLKLNTDHERLVSLVMEEAIADTDRYRIDFSYDGTTYAGFQRQTKTKNTIQGTVESVLNHFANKPVTIHASGRTDKGVHALNQTAHFDATIAVPVDKLRRLINEMLPGDIYIKALHKAPSIFHARFDAKQKTYQYRITHTRNSFSHHYTHHTEPLKTARLKTILKPVEGTHDFLGFSKFETEKDTVRTIHAIDIHATENTTIIEITANGFLRYMVRILIGDALYDYFHETDHLIRALNEPDKNAIKHVAPANGLYLKNVRY